MDNKKQKDNLLYKLLNHDIVSFQDPDANLKARLGLYPNFNILTYKKAVK